MPYIRKILFILVPLLIAASACVHVLLPAESDKGWLLHVAHVMLHGGRLYVDIIEVNPPLILWIYTLPVWISEHTGGLKDFEALACLGLLSAFFTAWVCSQIIRLHPAFAQNTAIQSEFALLILLIFIFYTPQGYFFDREHIFMMFIFPYMLRFMPALAEQKIPVKWQWVIGCLAAVGFCIKPHTVIIFVAIQLFLILRTRSLTAVFNRENYIIAAAGVLYLLAILIFYPDYFRIILPMVADTYSQFGNKGSGYFYLPPFFVAIGLMFADFRPWHVTPFRRDVYYFFGMCFAFLLYALANNGWGYTYNPLYCVLMLTAAWMLWEYDWLRREHLARGLPVLHIMFGMRGCIIVLVTHAAYMLLYLLVMGANVKNMRGHCDGNSDCWRNTPFVHYIEEFHIHSFGTISYDYSNWVSLIRATDAKWDTRFNCLWMMPKLIQGDASFRRSHNWILEYVGKSLADDLSRNKPEAIFVDDSPYLMGHPRKDSLLNAIIQIPEFEKAWTQYKKVKTIDNCTQKPKRLSACKYDVYRHINIGEQQ